MRASSPYQATLRRALSMGLSLIFLLAIALPPLETMLRLMPREENTENRKLNPRPEFRFSARTIRSYAKRFEQYYNDRFGFRDQLINVYLALGLQSSAGAAMNPVFEGKNDWLFFAENQREADNIRALRPFNQAELNHWSDRLLERQSWLAKQGIRHLIVFTPSKHTIYHEYLPASLKRRGKQSRLEQMVQHLRQFPQLQVLDLTHALTQAKSTSQLYYKYDTHWNQSGAFVGYQHILPGGHGIRPLFPLVKSYARHDFNIIPGIQGDLNIAIMARWKEATEPELKFQPRFKVCAKEGQLEQLPHYLKLHANYRPRIWNCNKSQLPKILVVHDSYIINLRPFLNEHFRQAVYVKNEHTGISFDHQLIQRQKPDIVLEQWFELKLGHLKLSNPPAIAKRGRRTAKGEAPPKTKE